jgi:ABC-type transport system involved in multi-copper enzyme maturation permease subunit
VRYSGITGLALTLSAGMWELIRSLWARRRAARKAGRSADVAMGEKEPLYIDAVPERVALDPTLVGREAFMDAPMAKNAKDAQMESPVVLGLIVALQRVYDNAVATKEIRARLRGKVQPQTILRTFVIFLAVTCALLFIWPQIATAFGAYMAGSLFPNSPTEPALVYASVLSLWYLALCGLSPFVGGSLLAGAFAAEYEKSTLGFTLTTPMRASDIAGGKAIGLLIVGGINQAYIALWTLLLSLGFSVQLGLGRSLLIWVQMTGIAALVTITVGLIGLAIASLFPKQITVKSGGVVQALMVYGVIFAPGLLGVMWTAFVRWIGLPPVTVVLLIVAALVLLAILGMVVAIYGVSRMRLSDVVYSPTRRSS